MKFSPYIMIWFLSFILLQAATEANTYGSDMQQAIDEMEKLFRKLFPLILNKNHSLRKNHFDEPNEIKIEENDIYPGNMLKKQIFSRDEESFRKRGASCMKKCIAQGILHPVQCHSLC